MHVSMINIAMRTQIQVLIQDVWLRGGGTWGHAVADPAAG